MQVANSSTKIGKFFQLDSSQRKILLKALVLLPGTAIRLALTGYKSTLRSCTDVNVSKSAASFAQDHENAKILARLVNIAANHGPYRALCLVRSLTLLRMMSASGLAGTLVLGARREDQRIAAHAWVLFDGEVINDVLNVEQSYSRFRDAGEVRE